MQRITTLLCLLVLGMNCRLAGQSNFQLTPESFEQKVKEAGAQVLDVRTPEEFKAGYIAGALQANWLQPAEFADRTRFLDKGKPVLIYCASGVRSGEAAKQLRLNGFMVYELSGGLNKYKKKAAPLLQINRSNKSPWPNLKS